MRQPVVRLARILGVCLLAGWCGGCATPRLDRARDRMRAGRPDEAEAFLTPLPGGETDRVLALMERGTARQARGDFENANRDWQAAIAAAEQLDYLSLSRGSASLVVNENVLAFRGAPFERLLLHSLGALNFWALAQWDGAAVEARRAVRRLERLDGFPDDAFTRYVCGLAFELADDGDAARRQYAAAREARPGLDLDPDTGRFGATTPPGLTNDELICFILAPPAPGWRHDPYGPRAGMGAWPAPRLGLRANGRLLGEARLLGDIPALRRATDRRTAAARVTRTVGRIAVKETVAHAVSEQNDALGLFVRLLFWSLETPDLRAWESLPEWIYVARVPCPTPADQFEIVRLAPGGHAVAASVSVAPLQRRRALWVTFRRL